MATERTAGIRIEGRASAAHAARRRLLRVIAGSAAALVGTTLAAGPRAEPAEATQASKSLVGAWLVTVPMTPRGRFITVQTFSADGTTVTQYESAGEEHGAAMGCGVWAQTGERTFASSFAAGLYDARTGAITGVAKLHATVVLDATGDAWSAEAQVTIFDPEGRQVEQTPRFPGSATRIQLEPLA